ncbi:dihydrofolate reductase family protein [Paenibacillus sp. J22TS3]|uniref:dihydrofolate reductase family protein n=1 Tax=Paenibacillus sp. J22TS3 TaxID=2807192 RepID=UPI001B19B25F|nr:dihydrofolate reductase family protein [Paenibacillus sp. J22TS3]GIP23795.1 hypothetical protein J22TS3_40700 [Paenibacillus sp. J22TS3]
MVKMILDMSMSLDGYISGLSGQSSGLHDWFYHRNDLRNAQIIDEMVLGTGAIVMGRRTYELGDHMDGFVHNPFRVPHFVLTHSTPERPAKGNTRFVFVTDGTHSAAVQAKEAAGGRSVIIMGGAHTARQYIEAGLIDEIHIHIVPVLLGGGVRLFESNIGGDGGSYPLEVIQVVEAPGVTHVKYRVVK